MLHIFLVIFISFISYTKVHLIHFVIHSYPIHFISLIHIYHIWLYSYYILNFLFSFDNPGDKIKLLPVLEKFSEYCNPRKNVTILCQKVFTYRQHEGEDFHHFCAKLKKLSSECQFDSLI